MEMNKKNVGVSILILGIVSISSYLFVKANDDYTCYNYSKTSSCAITGKSFQEAKNMSGVSCTAWVNGKSSCYGTKRTDTYTVTSNYRCSSPNGDGLPYTVPGQVCQVEYIDTQAPDVTGGGIE